MAITRLQHRSIDESQKRIIHKSPEGCVQNFYDASDNLIYRCVNANRTAGDGDATWTITKYTYTGTNLTKQETRDNMTVTGRAVGW